MHTAHPHAPDRPTPGASDGPLTARVPAPGVAREGTVAASEIWEFAPAMSTVVLVTPAITALRWIAVVVGATWIATSSTPQRIGSVVAVAASAALATWRTVHPLPLDTRTQRVTVVLITESFLYGLIVGLTGGVASPFIGIALVGIGVASFGWGIVPGAQALVASWAPLLIATAATGHADPTVSPLVVTIALASVVLALAAPALRARIDRRIWRQDAGGRALRRQREINDLLIATNQTARALPGSLDTREALATVKEQLLATFRPDTICLLAYDELHKEWIPRITEGVSLRPAMAEGELPGALHAALRRHGALLVEQHDGTGPCPMSAQSGSGLYTRLVVNGRPVGVLGLEHQLRHRYSRRDVALLEGLTEGLALTFDNARWFSRLRALGAQGERLRSAGDVHDRVGQWLTHIGYELEAVSSAPEPLSSGDLDHIRDDIQHAIGDLRDVLTQLRAEVDEGRPLEQVGREVAERFAGRSGLPIEFVATRPGEWLPVPIENELLRILQAALQNVAQHASATHVDVEWDCTGTAGRLSISDDGIGFDQHQGVRDHTFGLIDMRERADVIGGRLVIESGTGQGTTVTVTVATDDDGWFTDDKETTP